MRRGSVTFVSRRRVARILDRLAFVCFQHPPLDYDALEAYLDRMAGLDR